MDRLNLSLIYQTIPVFLIRFTQKYCYFRLLVGFGTTVICILVGYPLAYFIARAPARQRSLLLFLILLPFWTNFIIRIFAWMTILRSGGLLDSLLQWLHHYSSTT